MTTLEVTKASKSLAEYVKNLGDRIIVLTSNAEPVAALVSLKNVDAESLSLSMSSDFIAIVEQARQEFREGKKLSLAEMRATVAKMK